MTLAYTFAYTLATGCAYALMLRGVVLQCVAGCYTVLQCVAGCYNMLQCVAFVTMCCSVLRGVTM